jgi:hypothetical protein
VTAKAFATLELARRFLAEVRSVDEVKAIHDLAEAARVYARQASLGLEVQDNSAAIKLRAERRLGELLATLPKQDGGDAAGARSQAASSTFEKYVTAIPRTGSCRRKDRAHHGRGPAGCPPVPPGPYINRVARVAPGALGHALSVRCRRRGYAAMTG